MPAHESLDELLSRHAAVFADQVREAATMADTEEDIRIAIENQLAFIKKEAGVTLVGKHEVTVVSGRIDSVYDRVIIEYKNPASPADRLGPKSDSPGSKKVVDQIKKRFYDLRQELGHQLNTLFGVGTDGRYFVFVRYRDDKWQPQEPVEVNRYSAERFLWALYNLGQKGKPFSAEYLAGDFGSEAKLAQDGIKALYDAIKGADHPKAQTFFNQWKILFGEVCGYDVDSPSDKIKKLAHYYGIREKGLAPAEMLFAVHTYYAVFMKLLASEIVAFFHKLPTPLQKMIQAPTSAKLKREMEELEAGSIFRHLNITNFLEGDLFAWYLSVWSDPIDELIRKMVTKLDDYNPGTMSEDPAGSRDLLKKLYQQLFPKSVRHDLGEYYTPDWLAEHVLNELEYVGDPDKRILDPACGSGTFLVMAIVRIRRWYDEHREKCPFGDDDLCRKILANVVGFDLNPLAVMAARTNYLIAIRDLIGHVDKVEIPIYLCDSILTPSEYGDLFTGKHGTARELKTAAARFLIPSEIATNREHVAKYAEQLEHCVRNAYKPDQFIERCREESLPVDKQNLHIDLYKELVALDKANKNGVWARIIKNAFAPLFVGQFDYVAGNPPWVNWRHLPSDYRESMAPLWQAYELFPHKGLSARLGAGMDDISVLMTYVAGNVYLNRGGKLGFVITQTLFQSAGGGKGFRRFQLPHSKYFKVLAVHDFSSFQPFEGAANRTATVCFAVGNQPTAYPVRYVSASVDDRADKPAGSESLYPQLLHEVLEATPVGDDTTAPWCVLPPGLYKSVNRVSGESKYVARIGAHSGGAAGIFWVNAHSTKGNLTVVTNCYDAGRNKYDEVTASVESALVRKLLRGRDLVRWKAQPSLSIVIPYMSENGGKAITESTMRVKFPKTFKYFENFRDRMLARPHYLQHFKASGAPYWSMYNVGDYTFAEHRVAWREQSSSFQCAVVSNGDETGDIVADAKLIIVPCSSRGEGHFLAGCLNSAPARFLIESFMVSVQISTHVLKRVAVPTFNQRDDRHRAIAKWSIQCHQAAIDDNYNDVTRGELEIDRLAGELWKLSASEVRHLRELLSSSSDADLKDDE